MIKLPHRYMVLLMQDYYDRCSSRQFLKTIKVPTRIIHSSDDPFMFKETVPGREELSRFIDFI